LIGDLQGVRSFRVDKNRVIYELSDYGIIIATVKYRKKVYDS